MSKAPSWACVYICNIYTYIYVYTVTHTCTHARVTQLDREERTRKNGEREARKRTCVDGVFRTPVDSPGALFALHAGVFSACYCASSTAGSTNDIGPIDRRARAHAEPVNCIRRNNISRGRYSARANRPLDNYRSSKQGKCWNQFRQSPL